MIDVPAGVVPNNEPAATPPEATATSTARASPSASASDSGANGRHYQSARYKFSFSWGKDWSVSDDQSSATSDTLTLAHGDALLFSDVFPYDGTAKDCVNASIDQYQSGTVFSNVTPASETNGAPASGSVVHGGAFADVSADTTDANGKAESVGIEIVCWVVDPDAKVVARFEFVAPADQFEAEVKAFKKVVQTVKI